MEGTPLANHLYFRSRDVEETRDMVAHVYCDHRLHILQGKSLDAFQYEARLGSLSMSYMQYGARVSIDPGELSSFYLIQMPLRGVAEIHTGGTLVRSTPQLASIADPTQELVMEWSQDCSKLMLKIDRAAVTRYVSATLEERLPPRGLIFHPELDLTTRQGRHWMAIMTLLESYLSHFSVDKQPGIAAKSYEEMVLSFLLLHHPHNLSQYMGATAISQAVPRHVKKAHEFMKAYAAEPITMVDVAYAAGVSLRCLQQGFRRFRDITPYEALQQVRLDGARTDFLDEDLNSSITETALKWGFTHFGRFSQCYCKRFGELPSETRKRVGFPLRVT